MYKNGNLAFNCPQTESNIRICYDKIQIYDFAYESFFVVVRKPEGTFTIGGERQLQITIKAY